MAYIERKQVLELIANIMQDCKVRHKHRALNRNIKQIPSADVVEVKHGEWETEKEDIEWGNSLKRKYCSICRERPHFDRTEYEFILTDYCPHCGAKMDRKKEGE